MRSFAERSAEPELMDAEPVGLEDFRACLKDLATVNTLTLARRPTLAWLEQATGGMRPGEPLSLLDVGFGYGDMLRAIHGWCVARGFVPHLTGIDLNPWSAASAREATPAHMRIDYRTGDVFAFRPEQPVQFVVSSLFAHHLEDAQVAAFLAWMERTATQGWFINDLHRHPVPYYAFRAMARAAGWHRFVQHDGPVSIARAFRRSDWRRLIAEAGLDPGLVEIRWRAPFRLCVGRLR
ncbi:MAG: SAM (And some other nucleotide) binding motif [uncultured Microvirga sp.]|uniref:SAM (And some other nucleotide) binding motif n=1 Tax=uncultured Microvirga sp. TaxID=412392 RepID=A0A6J4MBW6_9HYPH|nr:MAG: SAM (And some other nucleotide) binding motif [uncultured Microvirga sp.]